MLIVALIAIAVLAAVAVFVAVKSREADDAVGMLSRETRKRDRESAVLGEEEALTGKQVERAQVLERRRQSPQPLRHTPRTLIHRRAEDHDIYIGRRQLELRERAPEDFCLAMRPAALRRPLQRPKGVLARRPLC